ncbi:hypothetical protein B9Y66_06985 [Stenotrophomonas maltophilia]|nr:hypothetical protein B9Y66_06985 [Stenotrophomonas maltophilia]
MAWIYRVDQGRHPPTAAADTHQQQQPTPCRSDRSREPVEGGVGPVAGVSAAWMPRPSPQGWVYGVPRNRTHPASPTARRRLTLRLPWPLHLRVPGGSPAQAPHPRR